MVELDGFIKSGQFGPLFESSAGWMFFPEYLSVYISRQYKQQIRKK
jgi:hypothetical protein